ncbi:MAG: dTMP kinase [Candidatus Dormibacteria bacterium]
MVVALSDPGFFVSVEGLDGSGKTTQVGLLAQSLAATGKNVVVVRDPGSTALGERVRDLLLEPTAAPPIAHWAETALFLASRVQLAGEVIQPALAQGGVVVSDRYLDSTLVYQGARGIPWEEILELHRLFGLTRLPDLTLILDLPADLARARREAGATPDRMEQESSTYHEKVRSGYLKLAERFPERVLLVNAQLPVAELAQECGKLTRERLNGERAI